MPNKIACLIVIFLPFYSQAQADVSADAKAKVQALESAWDLAEAKGDIGALGMLLDEGMVYIAEDGALLSKGQFLIRAAKDAGANTQWLSTQTISIHVYGDVAIVVGAYRAGTAKPGKQPTRQGRFIDTWARKNGAWVCVVAQATPVSR